MCFSATASFTAAAALGGLGLVCLARQGRGSGIAVAAMPVLFAAQQGLEGVVWLSLEQGSEASPFILAYLFFARVLWPTYAPAAVWLIEDRPGPRRLAATCAVVGGAVSIYLLWGLVVFPQSAMVGSGHIHYESGQPVPLWVAWVYAAAICLPLLAASSPRVRRFGLIVTLGGVVSALGYAYGFQSVWCFFAGLGSLVLCWGQDDLVASRGPAAWRGAKSPHSA